jgi:hypothetical protein
MHGTSSCARTKVLIPPPLNAITPALDEGWGHFNTSGIACHPGMLC